MPDRRKHRRCESCTPVLRCLLHSRPQRYEPDDDLPAAQRVDEFRRRREAVPEEVFDG